MFMKIKSEVCGMTKKQKRMLVRIIISFVLFAALMVAEHTGALEGINTWILFVIYLVPYLVIGYDIVYKAVDESLFYKLHGEIACLELYL